MLEASRQKRDRFSKQFSEFLEVQRELISSRERFFTGDSYSANYLQYLEIVRHVEQLWESSALLFAQGFYPQSLFLAVTCLEESGKAGALKFAMIVQGNKSPAGAAEDRPRPRRAGPFYSHPKKHLLIAGAGAIINSRLDRLIGFDRVAAFLEDIESGTVEHLRQSALYFDTDSTGPVIPARTIDRERAGTYVILAGELMAEVLGLEPDEWKRLLARVQEFERAQGYPCE